MPSLKSLVGLGLLILLIGHPVHAQESDACPYPVGRRIQDLAAALLAHNAWLEREASAYQAWLDGDALWEDQDFSGRANFCNADLNGANLHDVVLPSANLKGANLDYADLPRANLRYANLEGATLISANLEGADLFRTNLEGVILNKSNLRRTDLTSANLEGAYLFDANLKGSRMDNSNLKGAILIGANLEGASLDQTVLEDARLSGVDLSGALYQPATAPAKGYLSNLIGLQTVRFCPGEHSGLVQLRTALKTAGLRDLEREATYAIESGRTRHALARWNAAEPEETGPCPPHDRDRMVAVEGALRLVFLEWTTDYGLSYGRPIWILLGLIGVFTFVYLPALLITPKGPNYDSGIYRIWPDGRIKRRGESFEAAGDVIVEPLTPRGVAAFGLAFYFSVISAFHVGWRDLNVGSWIARMQPREYALRAKGWVRFVSGLQSLISVYLVAMWVLTYFGRPFE